MKAKEIISYLFFGLLTTLVSVASYALCIYGVSMHPLLANVVSWLAAVSFAYVTNRKWVFDSKVKGASAILQEMIKFFVGRMATLLMEEAVLYVGITLLKWDAFLIKIIAQLFVVVANYILSKLLIFAKEQ